MAQANSSPAGQRPNRQQAAPQPRRANSVEPRHVSNWGRVGLVVCLYSLAAVTVAMLLVWASIVWLLPPWVAFFDGIQVSAATSGLIPRIAVGFFNAVAQIISVAAFGSAQFYQSAWLLSKFGVINPQSKNATKLRYAFYGLEFLVVFSVSFGNAVGGWRGKSFNWLVQFIGFMFRNPADFIGTLFNIAAQTLAAETLIALTFTAIVLAVEATKANANHAIKQASVSTASASSWGESHRPQAQPPTTQAAKQKPNVFKHGEFVQADGGDWMVAINDASGKQTLQKLVPGIAIQKGDTTLIAAQENGQWVWKNAPKDTQPEAPKQNPRPQRRTANPEGQQVGKPIFEATLKDGATMHVSPVAEQPMGPLYEAVAHATVAQAKFTTEQPGTINADGTKQPPQARPQRIRTPR